MANQVGKRYVCTVCGAEFIVTRAGDGEQRSEVWDSGFTKSKSLIREL
jgi:hypothetical protein